MDIDDPVFRSKVISFASTGASRRTVAALCGKPESTLRGWVNRGIAFPDVEPYGSFAVDYQRAERGIAGAVAGAAALKVQSILERAQAARDWVWDGDSDPLAAPQMPDVTELDWAQKTLERRFPDDYGLSKHRQPDKPFSGDEWLDANAMTREQLGAVFADPPEQIKRALQDQAPAVYRILLEAGFDPSAPQRKATDGSEESQGTHGRGEMGSGANDEVDAGD